MKMLRDAARLVDRFATGAFRRWDGWTLPDFARPVVGLHFARPRKIVHPERVSIGDHCMLGPGTSLVACVEVGHPFLPQTLDGRIIIGDRVWATHSLQIFSAGQVQIGDDVMIAGNVFLCDYHHGHARADVPFSQQPFVPVAPITVGRGSWLGQNVVVMPGVVIGEYSIVGANSVVTCSLPARTIAVGAPARVIREFDARAGAWRRPGGGRP